MIPKYSLEQNGNKVTLSLVTKLSDKSGKSLFEHIEDKKRGYPAGEEYGKEVDGMVDAEWKALHGKSQEEFEAAYLESKEQASK